MTVGTPTHVATLRHCIEVCLSVMMLRRTGIPCKAMRSHDPRSVGNVQAVFTYTACGSCDMCHVGHTPALDFWLVISAHNGLMGAMMIS